MVNSMRYLETLQFSYTLLLSYRVPPTPYSFTTTNIESNTPWSQTLTKRV
jgi:hypothetical protein